MSKKVTQTPSADVSGGTETLLNVLLSKLAAQPFYGHFSAYRVPELPTDHDDIYGVKYEHLAGDDYKITASGVWGGDTHTRTMNAFSKRWKGDWASLATATPPEEHPLALEAGFEVFSGGQFKCCYSKAQNGLVVLHVAVNTVDGTTPGNWRQIAQLPVGYIPNGIVSVNYSNEAGGGGKLTVYSNGRVEVAFATNGNIVGTVCYYVAS